MPISHDHIVASKLHIVLTQFGKLVTEEEKKIIVQGILDTSFSVMRKKINTQTRKSRAKNWSNQHGHSASAQVTKSIFFNILTSKQKLPARQRDFKMNILGVEKVGPTELTRALSKYVRLLLLKHSKDKFPFGVGRHKPYFSEELRGKPSYYTESEVKAMIDEVLNDPLVIESLTNSLVSLSLFYEYLKVAFIETLNLLKENEEAFLDIYAHFGLSRKQLALNKDKTPNSSLRKVGKMTTSDIENLAEQYGIKTIRQFKKTKEMSTVFYTGNNYYKNMGEILLGFVDT